MTDGGNGVDEVEGADPADAYRALAATVDDEPGRWAFGGGGDRAGDGIADELGAAVPAGTEAADLAAYCLMLGDDALIAAQRLAGWTTRAPELEEEVALANLALDLLGQARTLLSRAGHLGAARPWRGAGGAAGDQPDEDVLAYFRDERGFRHVTLAEIDLGDFGRTIAWLLVLSSWRLAVMSRLRDSADPALAAVAARAVPELTYHRDWAARWAVRLGDGTEHSHARLQAGLDAVWPHVDALFAGHDVERRLAAAGVAVDPAEVRGEVDEVLDRVLAPARVRRPDRPPLGPVAGRGGRDGVHTEALGPLLAVLQSLARAHPEATW